MDTVSFHVPTITCGHCVKTIQRVVKEDVPGVGEITGDEETKQITITYGPPATIDQIVAALTEWGYAPAR
jgi:copper chaperone